MEAWGRYADYAGSTIDDGFDYTHGRDLWIEKLDYTKNWLAAHISDAQARTSALMSAGWWQGSHSGALLPHQAMKFNASWRQFRTLLKCEPCPGTGVMAHTDLWASSKEMRGKMAV